MLSPYDQSSQDYSTQWCLLLALSAECSYQSDCVNLQMYPCIPPVPQFTPVKVSLKLSFMQAIKKFERSIFPLFHCPRRYNFIRMLPCVVDSKCASGFENFVTGNTGVGNVQMDLCMPLNSLPLREGLVTTEAEKLPIMSARYHVVHQRIQGCCGHIINTFFI